jgi:hypothetical protein
VGTFLEPVPDRCGAIGGKAANPQDNGVDDIDAGGLVVVAGDGGQYGITGAEPREPSRADVMEAAMTGGGGVPEAAGEVSEDA